jgi:hypothetical protein
MKKYRRKSNLVSAIQLRFETDNEKCLFNYHKWGDEQTCKPYDWVVENNGETYTIDNNSFQSTYQLVTPGKYTKIAYVWAKEAESDGKIKTKEGFTHYKRGDMIVANDPNFLDQYAMSQEQFYELYDEYEQ